MRYREKDKTERTKKLEVQRCQSNVGEWILFTLIENQDRLINCTHWTFQYLSYRIQLFQSTLLPKVDNL